MLRNRAHRSPLRPKIGPQGNSIQGLKRPGLLATLYLCFDLLLFFECLEVQTTSVLGSVRLCVCALVSGLSFSSGGSVCTSAASLVAVADALA